jgi:hypothetical protein
MALISTRGRTNNKRVRQLRTKSSHQFVAMSPRHDKFQISPLQQRQADWNMRIIADPRRRSFHSRPSSKMLVSRGALQSVLAT